jgi:predicted ATPase
MLRSLALRDFKSFENSGPVELAPLTVLFGPNAAGKSNFIDAVQLLSRLASQKTLAEAFGAPIRGRAIEVFRFDAEGLAGLMSRERAVLELDATLDSGKETTRYRTRVAVEPPRGTLSLEDEYLAALTRSGEPKGKPVMELVDGHIHVRRKGKAARPYKIDVGQPFTMLSDRRFSGPGYGVLERCRDEFSAWRCYYLDPRVSMRAVQAPQDVGDIGPLGEHLAAFLYRLRNSDRGRPFDAVRRTVRTIVPAIEDIQVDLNPKRGELELQVRQGGAEYSSRVLSEGTLRVLALACVAVNPWGGTLVAFEEPENGVHPRRIELVAKLLASMAFEGQRQVIVATHSPLFCTEALRMMREKPGQVRMYNVLREGASSHLDPFLPSGPLFDDPEVRQALTSNAEDGVFEAAMLRGLLDG